MPKVNVLCELARNSVVGPFLFMEATVTENVYLDMLQKFVVDQLHQVRFYSRMGPHPIIIKRCATSWRQTGKLTRYGSEEEDLLCGHPRRPIWPTFGIFSGALWRMPHLKEATLTSWRVKVRRKNSKRTKIKTKELKLFRENNRSRILNNYWNKSQREFSNTKNLKWRKRYNNHTQITLQWFKQKYLKTHFLYQMKLQIFYSCKI